MFSAYIQRCSVYHSNFCLIEGFCVNLNVKLTLMNMLSINNILI